jgi:hypothetical protein
MPLDPTYVQRASQRQTPSGRQMISFENTSAQMADPGTLPQFFGEENRAEPMPFTLNHLALPEDGVAQIVDANIASTSSTETLTDVFEREVVSKNMPFRTRNMKTWNVRIDETELC